MCCAHIIAVELSSRVLSLCHCHREGKREGGKRGVVTDVSARWCCYASRQTYVEVNDTYFEGGTHEETLRPQRKARVMNKRRGD